MSVTNWPQSAIFLLITSASLLLLYPISHFFSPLLATMIIPMAAFLAAYLLHDRFWWKWMHLCFLPLLLLFSQLNIQSYWYLFALLLCWFIFGRVMISRVPLYLSNRSALQQLAGIVPEQARFLDIGAGTGTVLHYLAQHREDLSLSGVEYAKGPWLVGKVRLPANVAWLNTDYQNVDLGAFECVYAFLSSAAMPDLWQQAVAQMRPGTLFISNTFVVPEAPADQVIELNDWKDGKLFLWRM
ncbi:class I SAM-dependent methyltransferase [uncultured Deefgea sp.]|uniref:class I SAM-dependent methyltransferase n=1 Tax=uncultured Deefgea sp. TaxID=1304914 RepID=UPI002599D206|nr:class I SAM-dependent methyltransferase [uncultured Deefgea sp.]